MKREKKLAPRDIGVEELHAPAKRNFSKRRVIVQEYDDLWQVDIVEVHTRDSTEVITTYSLSSMYSASTRGHTAQE